jgi:hypothetical protein
VVGSVVIVGEQSNAAVCLAECCLLSTSPHSAHFSSKSQTVTLWKEAGASRLESKASRVYSGLLVADS